MSADATAINRDGVLGDLEPGGLENRSDGRTPFLLQILLTRANPRLRQGLIELRGFEQTQCLRIERIHCRLHSRTTLTGCVTQPQNPAAPVHQMVLFLAANLGRHLRQRSQRAIGQCREPNGFGGVVQELSQHAEAPVALGQRYQRGAPKLPHAAAKRQRIGVRFAQLVQHSIVGLGVADFVLGHGGKGDVGLQNRPVPGPLGIAMPDHQFVVRKAVEQMDHGVPGIALKRLK